MRVYPPNPDSGDGDSVEMQRRRTVGSSRALSPLLQAATTVATTAHPDPALVSAVFERLSTAFAPPPPAEAARMSRGRLMLTQCTPVVTLLLLIVLMLIWIVTKNEQLGTAVGLTVQTLLEQNHATTTATTTTATTTTTTVTTMSSTAAAAAPFTPFHL